MDISSDNANAKMPAVLVEEFSPSLPPEFPPERIPKKLMSIENICQTELLHLFKCVTLYGPAMSCRDQYDAFQSCKRQRDLQLFSQIKEWEIDYFSKMSQEAKDKYLQAFETKTEKLKEEFEKIPFASLFQNKLWRYSSDIEQLTWRANYLKKSSTSPAVIKPDPSK